VHLVWHGDDQPAEEVGQDLGQLDVDAGPALPILHHLEYRAVEPSSSLNIAAGLRDTPELPRTEERLPGGPSELRVLSGSPKPQAQPPKGSAWPGWPSSIKRDQKKAKQTQGERCHHALDNAGRGGQVTGPKAAFRLRRPARLAAGAPDELTFEDGRRTRSLLASRPGVVLRWFRRSDGGAGAGLAGRGLRQPHLDDRAHRQRQDAGGFHVVPRPAGD